VVHPPENDTATMSTSKNETWLNTNRLIACSIRSGEIGEIRAI